MAPRTVLTGLTLVAVAAAVAAGVSAHSTMTGPTPISNTKDCKVENGDRTRCPGPCPVKRMKNPIPVTTTSRGAMLPTRWYRNNHQEGFVRWALVPVDKANDLAAHEKGTFEWGCYETGTYKCTAAEKEEHCTFDNTGRGHKAAVEVPKSAPDGEYILGWVWIGGYNKPDIRFSDYYDCARIRIRGGAPLTSAHQPVFRPGGSVPEAGENRDRCLAHVNGVNMNQRQQMKMMKPIGFEDGRQPARIPTSFWGGRGGAPAVPDVAPPPPLDVAPAPPAPSGGGGGGRGVYGLGAAPSRTGRVTLGNLIALGAATRRVERVFSSTAGTGRLFRGGYVLVATAAGAVASVEFLVDGRSVKTEYTYPYTLGGASASEGPLSAWTGAPRGRDFTLQVLVRGKGGDVAKASWRLRAV